jgi:hypothetical protein
MVMIHTHPSISLYGRFMAICCGFAATQNSPTAIGISQFVRTFLEGLLTAGKNLSMNAIHSELSTPESGSPTEAVRRVINLSNFFC